MELNKARAMLTAAPQIKDKFNLNFSLRMGNSIKLSFLCLGALCVLRMKWTMKQRGRASHSFLLLFLGGLKGGTPLCSAQEERTRRKEWVSEPQLRSQQMNEIAFLFSSSLVGYGRWHRQWLRRRRDKREEKKSNWIHEVEWSRKQRQVAPWVWFGLELLLHFAKWTMEQRKTAEPIKRNKRQPKAANLPRQVSSINQPSFVGGQLSPTKDWFWLIGCLFFSLSIKLMESTHH